MIVRRVQARRLAYRAVDIDDSPTRPAHEVVVVVPDTPLEPSRAPGRLNPPDEPRGGERVKGVIHGLEGDMTDTCAHPGGKLVSAQVVTRPDSLQQRDSGRGNPQADVTQLVSGGRVLGCGHEINVAP